MVSSGNGNIQGDNLRHDMKRAFLVLFFLILSFSVFAIGFGYQVLQIRTMPEFGSGIFPTSIIYQFNLPIPDFIAGNTSLLTFRLDNGLENRKIIKNPDDGHLIDLYPELSAAFTNKDARNYLSQYDEFLLIFEQGFFHNDLIKLHFSFGGRFEMAFERFSYMLDSSNTEGLFYKSPGIKRYGTSSFSGIPELGGDRNVFQTFINFGFEIKNLEDRTVIKNGFVFSSMLRLNPEGLPLNDKTANFISSNNKLEFFYTPFFSTYGDGRYSLFSALLYNRTSYLMIVGKSVPYYAQDISFHTTYVPGTEHLVKNYTSLVLFGPQLGAVDLYPKMEFYHDIGYSFGALLNTGEGYNQSVITSAIGLCLEFNIYNISKLFYKMGYIYKAINTDDMNRINISFGFSLEV